MTFNKSDKLYFRILFVFVIVAIIAYILFREASTPYIIYFAALIGLLFQLYLLHFKNQVFLFMGVFKAKGIQKTASLIISWILLLVVFGIGILYLFTKF